MARPERKERRVLQRGTSLSKARVRVTHDGAQGPIEASSGRRQSVMTSSEKQRRR